MRILKHTRSLLLHGSIALGLSSTAIAADDANGADLSAEAAPARFATVIIPNMADTQKRWAESPYGAFTSTEWGQHFWQMATGGMDRWDERAQPLLEGMTSMKMVADIPGFSGPAMGTWIEHPQAADLMAMMGDKIPGITAVEGEEGRWTGRRGGEFTLVDNTLFMQRNVAANEAPELYVHQAEEGGDSDPIDLQIRLDYGPMVESLAGFMGEDNRQMAMLQRMKEFRPVMNWTLDTIGVREHLIMPSFAGMNDVWQQWGALRADTETLAQLPENTLWACSFASSAEVSKAGVEWAKANGMWDAQGIADLDIYLLSIGLPAYEDLITALDGGGVIYSQSGAPFPTITMRIGMEESSATSLIAGLVKAMELRENGDVYSGLAGMLPIQLGYKNNELIFTSNPRGIAHVLEEQTGFTDHEQIQAALKELPDNAVMAAVSRSGDSWGSLADLAAAFMGGGPVPGLANLGNDIRAHASYGYLWATIGDDQVMEMGSGGLLGGAMTMSMAAGISVPLAFMRRARAMRAEDDQGEDLDDLF